MKYQLVESLLVVFLWNAQTSELNPAFSAVVAKHSWDAHHNLLRGMPASVLCGHVSSLPQMLSAGYFKTQNKSFALKIKKIVLFYTIVINAQIYRRWIIKIRKLSLSPPQNEYIFVTQVVKLTYHYYLL